MSDPLSAASALGAHQAIATDRLRRSRRLWRALAFVALLAIVLALFARFGTQPTGLVDQIARVRIEGTIATDPVRLAILKDIGDDPQVKAVIVAINSPGGTTAGGEELYEALATLRAKKPVVAVIGELGASAAYMTAIGTDRIFARRLSIVGSIGVLYQHINAGKLLQTIGVDLEKVASGPLKAEPDLDEAIAPEVRRSLEAMITDSFNWFVDIVAERRALSRWQVLSLADGRIVTGRQALDAHLIDAIGGEAEALGWLEAEHGISADLPVFTVYPQRSGGFDWLGRLMGEQARAALGLPENGPIVLDGLVSLWQVGRSL